VPEPELGLGEAVQPGQLHREHGRPVLERVDCGSWTDVVSGGMRGRPLSALA
jgi:hypothetical protein